MSQEQTQQNQNLPASIQINKDGLLTPTNIEEAFRLARAYAMSGVLPDRYTNKPEMVLTASQMALELGLKPLTGLCKIAVVKGTPTVFGDLPLAMVQASGKLEYIKEVYFNDKGLEITMKNSNLADEVFGALCIVKRKGDAEPREAYFTKKDAVTAGLWGTNTWAKYPQLMLKYRARSQALKDKFADALNGIAIGEYDHNIVEGEVINVSPQNNNGIFSPLTNGTSLDEKLKKKAEAEPIDVEHSNEVDTIGENHQIEVSNE